MVVTRMSDSTVKTEKELLAGILLNINVACKKVNGPVKRKQDA